MLTVHTHPHIVAHIIHAHTYTHTLNIYVTTHTMHAHKEGSHTPTVFTHVYT